MLTSKQRAEFRSQANSLETTLMVGKGGVTETVIAEADNQLTARELAEYWIAYIPPHWNEYGIAKTNLRLGLLPPMSGEVDNEKWKTSNGAWIRSEIWAAFAPGVTDVAIRYAMADAMVDHGLSEGTYAEVFTATLQSLAYLESDIRALLESALKKIPEDSMVAKTVRLVMKCYDNGADWRQAREQVVTFNRELGWFQAPGNLGFVTIGLLYGEGDFKKSKTAGYPFRLG